MGPVRDAPREGPMSSSTMQRITAMLRVLERSLPGAAAAWLVIGVSAAVAAPVQFRTGPGNKVVAVSNLVPRDGCVPSRMRGRVAKREFNGTGLYLSGIVLENADGSRTFVNVDSEYAGADAVSAARVKGALETLLTVGRRVDLGVFACGAAGRVLTIHSVRSI